MRIVVSGASGLIGTSLVNAVRADGHEVVRLVRREPGASDEVRWNPAAHDLAPDVVSGADAVVHLAGAGVGDRPWTSGYKRTLIDSRIDGTTTIATAVARAEKPPKVLVSASAVGWYGDRGDQVVREDEPAGAGFLADLCRTWEGATAPAEEAGVRVAHIRSGLVLARSGGLLGRIKPLFALGLGGKLGSGQQYWPWISLRDEVAAIQFVLENDGVRGPVNLTGPEPATNAEFTAELARQLHRPAVVPVPAFALRAALWGFADEGILAGQRAVPSVLLDHGFTFTDPTLDSALRYALG
ncbi:TIGR01777 family oxidoreductase [Cryptosporangium phraense]|uniref:TIGR01777 family protein n=1 Tax=Cryptosporangium phraense TaxID=2593070 RepID=A0A545ATA9_9ACTN|nr:TIGR01777 family oxidoreductase [Cryptosporangium phraense]TQS44542.1 TIGR01777 family protein [Cryptosporangium phraense]